VISNPTINLKVPAGIIKRANEKGILSDLLFYYQLKSLNIDGSFKQGQITPLLISKFNYSSSSIWRKIGNLVKLDFIIKNEYEYNLISYDRFFSTLGYNLDEKIYYKNYSKRYGNFKIFKIPVNELNNFIERITYEEIKLNFKKQAYQILKQVKDSSSSINRLIPKNILKKITLRDISSFELINNYLIDQKILKVEDKEFDKNDISLSCSGIAKMMGFNSASKGWKLEKKLEKLGFLYIQPRKYLLEINDYLANILFKSLSSISPNYVLDQGRLYYYGINKLYLN